MSDTLSEKHEDSQIEKVEFRAEEDDAGFLAREKRLLRKIDWHLLPFLSCVSHLASESSSRFWVRREEASTLRLTNRLPGFYICCPSSTGSTSDKLDVIHTL